MCHCDTFDAVTKVEVQLCAGAVTALTQSGINNSSSLGASGVKSKVVTAGKIEIAFFHCGCVAACCRGNAADFLLQQIPEFYGVAYSS